MGFTPAEMEQSLAMLLLHDATAPPAVAPKRAAERPR
jgi:hypothetical protein